MARFEAGKMGALTKLSTMCDSLEHLLSQRDADGSLLEANQLSRRMDILDRLDVYFPEGDLPGIDWELVNSELGRLGRAIRDRLEAANSELYRSIRLEIQRGIRPATFVQLIQQLRSETRPLQPSPGNGYDFLDDLISGVFDFDIPAQEPAHSGPEIVPYQPTPARHILALVAAGAISEGDVVLDLGSGLGHVPLLVSLCTGARSVGVELELSYVACARQCAQALNLSSVSFLEGDARDVDLSSGTVFYLYTPFTGSILRAVMSLLRKQASIRPIKICTFGPCTLLISREPWLRAMTDPDPDQITIFTSRT